VRTFEGGHFFLAERVLAIVDEISQAFQNVPDTGSAA
jgi:surfactin synthase thioesterase subunit